MSRPSKNEIPESVCGTVRGVRGTVRFSPRCWPPEDDTVTLNVGDSSRTESLSGGGYGVLLDREQFAGLLGWVCRTKSGFYRLRGPQQSVQFIMGSDGLKIQAGFTYEGSFLSGMFRSVFLPPESVTQMIEWMDEKDTGGWEGWKSGLKREELKAVPMKKAADWILHILIDRGYGCDLDHGTEIQYFAGPGDVSLPEWMDAAEAMTGEGERLIQFTARPAGGGRWEKTGSESKFQIRNRDYVK